jgi:glycosyltransferase involved in cell wall biosynthesis
MGLRPRVGIIAQRFPCPGGVQTCFIELVGGLNTLGIIPDVLWDEPINWQALCNPEVRAGFGGATFPINSSRLRLFPERLRHRIKPINIYLSDFPLQRYDFVYSFEAGVRMKPGINNLCYAIGPPYVLGPGQEIPSGQGPSVKTVRQILSRLTSPSVRPDKHSRYVTISEWIADLFLRDHGFKPPIIWPPTRTRKFDENKGVDRSGFLFLSRLNPYKNPDIMLSLAKKFPRQPVTIAGASVDRREIKDYVRSLRRQVHMLGLNNVNIIENPYDEEIARLLQAHAIFIFPAPWEHFGIVSVEAIQAGLIPLVHDSGGQREIVPFDFLRFKDEHELIERAHGVMSMSDSHQKDILNVLSKHVERGSSEYYREAMLSYLRQDLGGI